MKITRPLLASAAAIAIAAGTVPVIAQDTDKEIQPVVDTHTLNDDTTVETPKATDTGVAAEVAAEPEAGAIRPEESDEVTDNTPEIPEIQAPEATEEELDNMPNQRHQTDAGAVTVTPLTQAPLNTANKKPQKWFSHAGEGKKLDAYNVYSPAMERDIPVAVLPARDAAGALVDDAPIVYLLNGAGGAEQDTDWINLAGSTVYETFEGQSVNVVIPMEGAFSYYVDWLTDPGQRGYYKGKQMWSTFLTKELPGAMEQQLNANDRRAIVGFSMSATSALLAAEHNPGMYNAVGSFSGCAATSTPLPYFYAGLTVNRGANGMTPESIWGPMGSKYNRYNDALVNAEGLRNTALYISTATGLQSDTDMLSSLLDRNGGNVAAALDSSSKLTVEGGAIEAAMNACTHDLRAKLTSLNIPAHYELRNTGTHSWPGWRDDLKKSWNLVIKPALGLSESNAPAPNTGSAEFSSVN
ncbi:alpha/beta hydrolase [Corynebacterium cystitidis]|uniref:alpha/beta hydrolase n=1 Tax=Corynebacterium cystitidis TaxID=35757 RepID=UPI00211ED770|nr:alpha/beta hydrolase family protein [Corynebacterium cystitidis]